MKKVLLTIVCVILAIVAFAQDQNSGGNVNVTSPAVSVESLDGENLHVTVDSVAATLQVVNADPVDFDTPIFVSVPDDGAEFILYKGAAYSISENVPNGFFDLFNQTQENNFDKDKVRQITKVIALAVAFIVPCFTIVIVLICLLVFWLKRSKSKNAIIAKAIEAGYDLPDAFYTGQSSQSSVFMDSNANMGNNSMDVDNGQSSRAPFTPIPVGARDPKMFTSSVSLVAVGLSLLLFFCSNGHEGVGFLCGGIPLFLGIGRLIAYLYIPGARDNRSRKGQPMPPRPPYGNAQPQNFSPRHFDNVCPPPTPGNNGSAPMNDNNHPVQ